MACSSGPNDDGRDTTVSAAALQPAMAAITGDEIIRHVNRLASDGFEGRGPGTAGEDSSVAYITEQFKALGLAPGNPDGSYIQPVSMIGYTSHPEATIAAGGKAMRLRFPGDYVAVSRRNANDIRVDNSDIVFVGYGVVAPEYGWDDYKGLDVKGKTIVMLVNDPAVPSDPNDSTQARLGDVQGAGDDVLRPLDVQVRDRIGEGRGCGDHRARDSVRRIPVGGRVRQLGR